MTTVDDLITSLDDDSFEARFESMLGGLDKEGMATMMADMATKVEAIPDQQKRHLFKNGIGSLQMMMDMM